MTKALAEELHSGTAAVPLNRAGIDTDGDLLARLHRERVAFVLVAAAED